MQMYSCRGHAVLHAGNNVGNLLFDDELCLVVQGCRSAEARSGSSLGHELVHRGVAPLCHQVVRLAGTSEGLLELLVRGSPAIALMVDQESCLGYLSPKGGSVVVV